MKVVREGARATQRHHRKTLVLPIRDDLENAYFTQNWQDINTKQTVAGLFCGRSTGERKWKGRFPDSRVSFLLYVVRRTFDVILGFFANIEERTGAQY